MNQLSYASVFAATMCAASVVGQGPDLLLTFSQPERALSGSAGTVLQALAPNEIHYLEWSLLPCSSLSTEKVAPRTCFHVMAGDENGDGVYWNPTIFGRIDALCVGLGTAGLPNNASARNVFWSPSAAMGTFISGLPLRPGDVGRIVNLPADGSVEYFMRQEEFDTSLGLPTTTAIDVDAIAWDPNYGVLFSLDQDIVANTLCGPLLVRDGDVLIVPPWAITWTPDFRVQAVLPGSAAVAYSEAQMDAFVVAAGVTDRNGVCLTSAVDTEDIEIDLSLPPSAAAVLCSGVAVPVPELVFATETMTGGSLLSTFALGQIYVGPCGPVGTSCGSGPTLGNQIGIVPTSSALGAPSYVAGLAFARTCRYVLEPQQHVQNVFPAGAPSGASSIDLASPWFWNFVFLEIVPPTVPLSITVTPFFSLLCFPDYYFPSFLFYMPVPAPGGFGSFPMPGIPPLWTGKVLFQSFAFGGSGLELSTPCVVDVQ